MASFGSYPTPVEELSELSRPGTALWIKRDDLTHPTYGGNKVRKIGLLFEEARRRGKSTIVTVGAIGSHHVLTTAIFGRSEGMKIEAVVVGQPRSPHVLQNLRADVAQGARLFPASSYAHAAVVVASRIVRGAYYIPAGGSNAIGTVGYFQAASELAAQINAGVLPEPDLLVVALGSGGTAAGLVAGLATEGLRTRVLAVTVAEPAGFVERSCRSLAKRCAEPALRGEVLRRLEVTRRYLGPGYGHATGPGKLAEAVARKVGVTLDATYTAKTFAAALDSVAAGRARNILYWHTLSSAPMQPLLAGAPGEDLLDRRLLRLARGSDGG